MILTRAQDRFHVETGLIQWLATAVLVAGIGVVIRGLTAKRRTQKDMRDARSKALAVLEPSHLIPVLTEIAIFVGKRVDWGVSRYLLGQPEDRVPVVISHNDLAAARQSLVSVCADAYGLDALQDDIVDAAKRQALWAIAFLPAWGYLVFWASQSGLRLPVALTVACFGMVCASAGAVVAERLAELRAGERFAALERRYEPGLLK